MKLEFKKNWSGGPMNFANFLITLFLKNTCGRLLLEFMMRIVRELSAFSILRRVSHLALLRGV